MTKLLESQKIFGPFGHWVAPATLIVQANGGAVDVEILADADTDTWIALGQFAADGVHKVEVNNATLRVTPTVGAKFSLIYS